MEERRQPPAVVTACSEPGAAQARLADLMVPKPESEALYGLAPGIDTCFEGAGLSTDELGLRVDRSGASSLAGDHGAYRILLIGDSRAFGWALPFADSPGPRIAEALARQPRIRRPVEVVNAAVPAYNATQEAALLAELAPRVAPDCVLVAFTANDLAAPIVVPRFRALTRMAETGKAVDAPVVQVATYRRAPLDRRKTLADLWALGLGHLDATWPEGERYRVSPRDPHPNPRANRVFVRRVAAGLLGGGLCRGLEEERRGGDKAPVPMCDGRKLT